MSFPWEKCNFNTKDKQTVGTSSWNKTYLSLFFKENYGFRNAEKLPSLLGLTLFLAYPFPTRVCGAPWPMRISWPPLATTCPGALVGARKRLPGRVALAHPCEAPTVQCRHQASRQLWTKCCGPSALHFVSSVENSTGSDPFQWKMFIILKQSHFW